MNGADHALNVRPHLRHTLVKKPIAPIILVTGEKNRNSVVTSEYQENTLP